MKKICLAILLIVPWSMLLVFVVDVSLEKALLSYELITFFDMILTLIFSVIIALLFFVENKKPYSLEEDMKQTLIKNGNIVG